MIKQRKKLMINLKTLSVYTTLFMLFSGCSNGETSYSLADLMQMNQSEDNTTTEDTTVHQDKIKYGLFLDAAVEGLEYRNEKGEENVTTEGGRFSYVGNEQLHFHVGKLELGSSNGRYIATPREMVKGTSLLESPVINNRVRLLLALDSDADRYGIQIDDTTRATADLWPTKVDFTKEALAFSTEVESATDGYITLLPTALDAKNHLIKTLECAYSGAYQGAWDVPDTNTSSGYIGVMVRADGGVVVMGDGQTIKDKSDNDQNNSVMYVIGHDDVEKKEYSFDNNIFWYYDRSTQQLESGDSSVSISGVGKHVSYNIIEGSFVQDNRTGSYRAYKSDATKNAAYRFTGFGNMFSPDINWTVGMIIMDIDPDGNINGKIHDVRDTMAQPKLSGKVDFNTGNMNMTVLMPGNTSYVTGTITFDENRTQSVLRWHDQHNTVQYGEVVINGCQLRAINRP